MTEITIRWDSETEKMRVKNLKKLSFTQLSVLKYTLDEGLDLVLKETKEFKIFKKLKLKI